MDWDFSDLFSGGDSSSWLGDSGDWFGGSATDWTTDWANNLGSSLGEGSSSFLEDNWLGDLMGSIPDFSGGEEGSWFNDLISGAGNILGGGGQGLGNMKNLITGGTLLYDILNRNKGEGGEASSGKIGEAAMEQLKQMNDLMSSYIPLFQSQMNTELELAPTYAEGKKGLIRQLLEGEAPLKDRYLDQASADVASSFAKQRDMDKRRLGMMGVNPNSGQFGGYMGEMGLSEAQAQAGARTMANRQAEDTALSRQGQAINFQRGVPFPNYQMSPGSAFGGALESNKQSQASTQQNYNGIGYGLNKLFGGV